jgi:GYF domain 2
LTNIEGAEQGIIYPCLIIETGCTGHQKTGIFESTVKLTAMKKYYFHDGTMQHGPFDLEELKEKNISAETPIWFESMPDWKPAGQIDELKDFLVHIPPAFHTTAPPAAGATETLKTTVIPLAATPVAAATNVAKPMKKSTAWVSWVLSLLVLGATGYYIYMDMQKNKVTSSGTTQTGTMPAPKEDSVNVTPVTKSETTHTTATVIPTSDTSTSVTQTKTTTRTPEKPVLTTPATKKTATSKTSTAPIVQPQKTEEDTKKTNAAILLAKEAEIRNHWPKYISFGKLDYKSHSLSGIKAFDVPVYNATDAVLDKVTVRLDYIKSGGGVYKSETLVITMIPSRSGSVGKAPASSRGTSVNVYITGIISKKLHFCYPQNNGNPGDPYFCK